MSLRVSTDRQGQSGLGLEAQRSAVVNFAQSFKGGADIVKEFVEVETGKRADRPVLAEAIRHCKEIGATLLVAKLDRLSRNLHFVTALQNSKVDFVAADNPRATPFLIHILVAMAEQERNMISSRTKSALEAAKRRGTRLGNPRYAEAISKAVDIRQKIAAHRNAGLRRVVSETMEKTGLTKLAEIAHALNLRGIKTNVVANSPQPTFTACSKPLDLWITAFSEKFPTDSPAQIVSVGLSSSVNAKG